MTDRELLELAAKAVGLSDLGTWDDKWGCLTDYEGWTFDPLNDDGDALRLAVALGIDLQQFEGSGFVEAWKYPGPTCAEDYGTDPYAATRCAIVRAAAEIGRQM